MQNEKVMTNEEVAMEMGRLFANTMFKDMLNVNFQGKNFNWDNFPAMFSDVCAASLFTAYDNCPENISELEEVAKKSLEKEGERLKVEYQKSQPLPLFDGK